MNLVFEALSHPVRRRILVLLRDKSMSAGELASHFDLSKPTLSVHFNKLVEAELVIRERQGTSLIYTANLSVLEDALSRFLDFRETE
ncbi:MAG: winged helix-turn-helix transcriptional regulator [Hyphomicrobiaceae bacterium]|nr:winged helix-turn-helix transcriptional regulator [Hyphomicrobiaceae bacterium]MCC0023898.1 winged helix-turn-helix transcriptional regulator [Hyphomicrobiaceae bacterium]